MAIMEGVLSGTRVLDFGRYIAAPYCGALLGALGAEVIRIEPVEGNDDRYVMPIAPDAGALYCHVNQNKVSLPLDLRHPRASLVLERLVLNSDVVLANMVPSTLHKMGLNYEALRRIKDNIILTNITAYGSGGPQRDSIGFDGTGQAMSGAIYLSGWEGQPFRAAVSYVDYGTALASAFATLAAIHARSRTGQGQEVQTSLLSTALTMMNPILIEEASGERSRTPIGNRSPIAGPSDVFATLDRWIVVQVIGQQMFERWTEIVEAPHLIDDPRFKSDIGRGEHGQVLSDVMSNWCKTRTSTECIQILRDARIPSSPVLTPAEALQERQNLEAGFMAWESVNGFQRQLPFVEPFELAGTPTTRRVAPALGEGGFDVLRRVGFTEAEVRNLDEDGVLKFAIPAARGSKS
jgi:crotonobetainyl-CoA:carnitine CoA-transferase CaiB-like acyl-CoA transferase